MSTASASLDRILRSPRLPSLPGVAVRVLELTRQPRVNMDEVANVVRNDQALAAKVLRTVNSSYYGLSRPCTTIKHAIVYLGLNTVKTLVLGFSLVDSLHSPDEVSFDYVDYWRRGLYGAVAARDIASQAGCADPEAAFLAALMQDLGMVAMHRALGDRYLQCVDMANGDHRRLPALERRAFETDHAFVGAKIATKWNMPKVFVDAIEFHHDWAAAPPESAEIVRAVHMANLATMALTAGHDGTTLAQFQSECNKWFGKDAAEVKRLLGSIAQATGELSSLFHVDIGSKPDIEALLGEAEDSIIALQADQARPK